MNKNCPEGKKWIRGEKLSLVSILLSSLALIIYVAAWEFDDPPSVLVMRLISSFGDENDDVELPVQDIVITYFHTDDEMNKIIRLEIRRDYNGILSMVYPQEPIRDDYRFIRWQFHNLDVDAHRPRENIVMRFYAQWERK